MNIYKIYMELRGENDFSLTTAAYCYGIIVSVLSIEADDGKEEYNLTYTAQLTLYERSIIDTLLRMAKDINIVHYYIIWEKN